MDQKFKSILDELCDYTPVRDRELFIESRAQQVIASATNLLRLIKETYSEELAEDLSRRLIRAITSGDDKKFSRRVRAISETAKR